MSVLALKMLTLKKGQGVKVMWGKVRNLSVRGAKDGQIDTNGKRLTRVISVIFLTLTLVAMNPGSGNAALSPPNWMPGSPIMAGNQVILLWAPVPGAVKYVIYMNGKKLQESVSIQVIVPAPDDAGVYEFQVAAVDAASAEGAKSSPGIIKIFKLTPPKGLEGRLIGKIVALHWAPVGGAVLYNVYRSTESGKGFDLAESIQDVRWTDSKIEENKKYFYRVTAKDASGKESDPSAEFAVSTEVATAGPTRIKNVTGKKTKPLAMLTDKDIADTGIVRIFEPYDIEPSPDYSRYYVSSVNTKAVLIIDADGNFIKEFGGDPEKPGSFSAPYGIGVGPDGRVYVADAKKNNVQVFSADGNFEKVFATVARKKWMTTDPQLADVDVGADGNVYVLEYRHGAVIKYDGAGNELSYFTKRGSDEDETGFLTLLKVIGGNIYLADGARGRVMVTDQKGKTTKTVGQKGVGVGLLQAMGGFDVTQDGKVFIVDRSLALVQVYNLEDGEYLFTLANEDNTSPMPLMGPKSIAVDGKKERVFVAQGIINQVRSFEMFGKPEEAKGGK